MKINCPGCKAPFNIDDHRIPEAGLKMRCPKCNTGFLVTRAAPSTAKKTMLGAPAFQAPEGAVQPKKPAVPPQKPLIKPEPPKPVKMDKTDLPVPKHDLIQPPPMVTDLPTPKLDSAPPTIQDLPAPKFDSLPPSLQDLPSPKLESIQPPAFGAPKKGVPAPLTDLPVPKREAAPPPVPDLPSPKRDSLKPPPDLPAVKKVSLPPVFDLPAPKASGAPDPFEGLDLPGPKSERSRLDLPAGTTTEDPFGGLQLPIPKGAATSKDASISIPKPPVAMDDPFGSLDLQNTTKIEPVAPAPHPPAPAPAEGFVDPLAGIEDSSGPATEEWGSISIPTIDDRPPPAAAPAPPKKDADMFDMPLPKGPAAPPAAPKGNAMDSGFGDIDLPMGQHKSPAAAVDQQKSIGGIEFGQMDLGGTEDAGMEFSAFPTQKDGPLLDSLAPPPVPKVGAQPSGSAEGLDLAISIDHPAGKGVIDDFAPGASLDKSAKKKGRKIKLRGKRTIAIQIQNVRYVVLGLVLALAGAGAMLTFTPYGPFGAYYIASLLPGAVDASLNFESVKRAGEQVKKDTLKTYSEAFKELDTGTKPNQRNENLIGFTAYVHYLYELRFGPDDAHDKKAIDLLGPINVDKSKEGSVKIAWAAKLVQAKKYNDAIKLVSKPFGEAEDADDQEKFTFYNNERLFLLGLAQLESGDAANAESTFRSLLGREKSPRILYQLALALEDQDKKEEAARLADEVLKATPGQIGAKLLSAELKLEPRGLSTESMAILNEVTGMGADSVTPRESAHALALIASIQFNLRDYLKAEQAAVKALGLYGEDVTALVVHGKLFLVKHVPGEALSAFIKALAYDPKNLDAALGRAEALTELGSLKEAKEILIELRKAAPKDPRVHYLLGRVYEDLNDPKEAETRYSEAITLDKRYLEPYVGLSGLMLKLNRDKEAMKLLDDARQSVPDSAAISTMLAEVYAMRGDLPNALVELEHAVALDPDQVKAHFRMAQIHREMGNFSAADKSLVEVERRAPSYHGLMLERAKLLQATGKMEDALATYQKALSASPDDPTLMLHVGAAQYLTGRLDLAKESLSKALAKMPDSSEAHYYMGRTLHDQGLFSDAQREYLKALARDEKNPLYHLHYGINAVSLKNIPTAFAAFKKTLEFDAKNALAYLNQGKLKLREGATQAAITDLNKALELDPKLKETFEPLGDAYDQLRNIVQAISYYEKAVAAGADNGQLQLKLAFQVQELKGSKQALPHLRRAVDMGEKEFKDTENLPPWLPSALARLGAGLFEIGQKAESARALKRYVEIAPPEHLDQGEVRGYLDRFQ